MSIRTCDRVNTYGHVIVSIRTGDHVITEQVIVSIRTGDHVITEQVIMSILNR